LLLTRRTTVVYCTQAALAEREVLKQETSEAREKAARLRGAQPAQTDPAAAAKKLAAAKRAAARISGKPEEGSVSAVAAANTAAANVPLRSVTLRIKPDSLPEDLPPPDSLPEDLPPPAAFLDELPPPPPAVDNHMLDLMMADTDFMALQDELLTQMEADLMDGYDAGDVGTMLGDGGAAEAAEDSARWRCASTVLRDRVDFVQTLDMV
jgi:hypothetical protein